MTDVPPPGGEQPTPASPPVPTGAPAVPPQPSPADRIRVAYQARPQSDYLFSFWTAFGWTVLTCGIYQIYVVYQLVRRSRDHNLRRMELLDASTTFAWQQAEQRGFAEELRPNFTRIAGHMAVLRQQAGEFREPVLWAVIALFARGIVELIVFWLLDADLVRHDYAEGAIETELSAIFSRLGTTVPPHDPAQLKQPHNYVGRVIAAIATCGIYTLFWEYDVMTEGNRHFEQNWVWEDALAQSVQRLSA